MHLRPIYSGDTTLDATAWLQANLRDDSTARAALLDGAGSLYLLKGVTDVALVLLAAIVGGTHDPSQPHVVRDGCAMLDKLRDSILDQVAADDGEDCS